MSQELSLFFKIRIKIGKQQKIKNPELVFSHFTGFFGKHGTHIYINKKKYQKKTLNVYIYIERWIKFNRRSNNWLQIYTLCYSLKAYHTNVEIFQARSSF